MINFNEIIDPIELAIVKWVQHYSLTSPVKTLQDLTNGELLIFFLKKVTYFQFVQPCTYSLFDDLTLSEKMNRMKLIGRSIMNYYKREIMKEIAGGNFNYVEMCTGNKEELMRMVILFMGIVVTNFDILKQIEDYMSTSEEDSVAYMKIIIDYAKKLSQDDQEDNDSPLKKQKRLITKLEIMEEQIQYYEEYTKQLQAKVEKLTQDTQKFQRTVKEYSVNSSEMLKRIDQLQSNNEQLLKQIAKISSNQQLINAKLTKNRQLADQSIAKLIQDIDRQKQDTIYYKKLVLKYEHVEALNKQLTNYNSDLSKQLIVLKGKYQKNIEILHEKQLQLENMNKINIQICLQNDSLKVKIELIEKSFTNNRSIHFSPQQKSIVVHKPLDLSTTSNNNNLTWFNFKEKEMGFNNDIRMGDSLTLTLKSNQSFVENRMNLMVMQQNKQNNINCANLASVPESQCSLNGIAQQKSFDIDIQHFNSLMKLKEQRDLQSQFLIQMITQMYDYMQSLRKQLKKYQLKEVKQLQRAIVFKQKVNSMFA